MNSANSFNVALAKLCVQASADAYTAQPTVRNSSTDTNVLIKDCGDYIMVAARGTASLLNFVTDAKAWRVRRTFEDSAVEIHEGFVSAVESVINVVVMRVAGIQPGKPSALPIILTGHSLGGALAVLMAGYLADAGQTIESIYTFGQPRVGNAAFAKAFQTKFGDRYFRFDDQADVVPCVPGMLIGYRHCPNWEFMPAFGDIEENPKRLVKLLTAGIKIWIARKRGPAAVLTLLADHHVSKYAARFGVPEPSTPNLQPTAV